jgi:DNA polymerase III psi subunit
MIHPENFSTVFQEELYHIPAKPIVALAVNWSSIRESEKVLLEKILVSVRLSLNHVCVTTTNKLDVLQWTDKPSQVIAFGIDAPGLSRHELIEIHDIRLIVASSLADLETDQEAKKKLWNSLRQMFQP